MHKESIMQPICDRELHEECGVFGVVGVPDAANLTYYGLHSLQHRGQEGCGIVSVRKEGRCGVFGAKDLLRRCSTKPSWQTLRAIWPSVMSVIRRPVAAGRRIYSLFCSIITRVISHWPTTEYRQCGSAAQLPGEQGQSFPVHFGQRSVRPSYQKGGTQPQPAPYLFDHRGAQYARRSVRVSGDDGQPHLCLP